MINSASVAHSAERVLGKDEVTGSTPVGSSIFFPLKPPKFIGVATQIATQIFGNVAICSNKVREWFAVMVEMAAVVRGEAF